MLDERLKRLIERELEEIGALLVRSEGLLQIAEDGEPSFERLAALSQILNSFYTGLERIFERIAGHIDHVVPEGQRWHAELLVQIGHSTSDRPAVISEESRACVRTPYCLGTDEGARNSIERYVACCPGRNPTVS